MLRLLKLDSPVWEIEHLVLSAKPQKPKHPVYKIGQSDFSRHNIVTRQYSSLHFKHSKIHICIKWT
jgi:hypothetical protein